ncbi:MAG: heavy metal-binding domain-containing protein [Acidimicrobiales bacterium]
MEDAGGGTPEGAAGDGPGDDAAGGPHLPEAAARRLGSGAWSSGLSIVDFASCLSSGMEPLGFVQGFSVMQWSWYAGTFSRTMGGLPGRPAPGQYSEGWQCPHGFVGGEHRMYGYNFEQTWVEESWSTGWGLAYGRMVDEAESLGAHGVIGVVDEMQHLSGTGAAEFRIRGTAVAVPGAPRPSRPFTTLLSGQRLAKLVEAGYVPVSVAAAMSSVQMFGYCITHYQLAGSAAGNWSGSMSGGIAGVHSIVQVGRAQRAARHLARERVRQQLGGDVLHGASVEQFENEIGEGDLAIQCLIRGTRVQRFKDFDPLPEPEPVVRLS